MEADTAEKVEIIYQDADMLVVNKIAGWVTTREGSVSQVKFVEDWVAINFPNRLPRKGIVHRLDKGTSGVLVVAKNQLGLEKLKQQFSDKVVTKEYVALVGGEVPREGTMNVPVGRLRGLRKFGVTVEGRSAVTRFVVVEKYRHQGKELSLLRLFPKTGRTHQIRVHLKYLGWPIVGDRLYGGLVVAGLDRPFLHAAKISLWQPTTGQKLIVEARLPMELDDVLKNYEKVVD